MMTYELAKELKDAGFPQKGTQGIYIDFEGKYENSSKEEDLFYCPTLEELIEACGNRVCLYVNNSLSYATIPDDEEPKWAEGSKGSTPSEAVARLWLALNKK